jgi:hypothetical protein
MAKMASRKALARSIWRVTVDGVGMHQLKKFSSDLGAEYHFSRPGRYSVQARLYVRGGGHPNIQDVEVVLTHRWGSSLDREKGEAIESLIFRLVGPIPEMPRKRT